MQRTLSIIKPDGVRKQVIGRVVSMFEEKGIRVVGIKMLCLTKEKAMGFYRVHKDRPFFDSLTTFMSSGPVVAMVLEGEDVIDRVRDIMGATDPKKAAGGTIRNMYASDIEKNIVHGSDSPESAAAEIPYFFSEMEMG
ncbi:MAG: nucleoside-diphosphate kinase [Deltaproteobacteria bacterium]|nr:nucleoside-diphosphate kinase [Deltaproteobacteria bacterium]MCL5277393.1 nucleoside-diphosphate kinase [Deltaproteobacteria bacterium]